MDSGEKRKNNIEANSGEWSELEELANVFPANNTEGKATKETPERRHKKIAEAAADVKMFYEQKNNKSQKSPDATKIATDHKPNSNRPSLKLLAEYDTTERAEIDEIRKNISPLSDKELIFLDREMTDNESAAIRKYEKGEIAPPPGTITKIARTLFDKLGIKINKIEERRRKEIIHRALDEYFEEKAKAEKERAEAEAAEIAKAKGWAAEQAKKRATEQAEKRAAEERKEKEELLWAMEHARKDKRDIFQKQRIQEIIERELNSRLLKIDDLEIEVAAGNPLVQKRIIPFEGRDIVVYDLKGLPATLLTTAIDYKEGATFDLSTGTAEKVLRDPSFWDRRWDELEKDGFKADDWRNTVVHTIDTSLWDTERNLHSHYYGKLLYGYQNVWADSVVGIYNRDGGTTGAEGKYKYRPKMSSPNQLRELTGPDGTKNYNEVTTRRYTENGIPHNPDYIVTENGWITEESLVHAKYFEKPIVNVEMSIYEKRAEQRGEELIDSISEDDTYEEIYEKVSELYTMWMFKDYRSCLQNYGNAKHQYIVDPRKKRHLEKLKIEYRKRFDFIKDTLKEETEKIKSATKNGSTTDRDFSKFNLFEIEEFNDRISIKFKIRTDSPTLESNFYNHANTNKKDPKSVQYEDDSTSFYDTLKPLVQKYYEARSQNQKIK